MKHLKSIFESVDNQDLIIVQNEFSHLVEDDVCRVYAHNSVIGVRIFLDEDEEVDTIDVDTKEGFNKYMNLHDHYNKILHQLKVYLSRLERKDFTWSIKKFEYNLIVIEVWRKNRQFSLGEALIQNWNIDWKIKYLNPNPTILKKVLLDEYGLELISVWKIPSSSDKSHGLSIKGTDENENFKRFVKDIKEIRGDYPRYWAINSFYYVNDPEEYGEPQIIMQLGQSK